MVNSLRGHNHSKSMVRFIRWVKNEGATRLDEERENWQWRMKTFCPNHQNSCFLPCFWNINGCLYICLMNYLHLFLFFISLSYIHSNLYINKFIKSVSHPSTVMGFFYLNLKKSNFRKKKIFKKKQIKIAS